VKLAAVRKFAMALPEVTEEPHFHLTSFRVHGKIFVTAPPEETHLRVFVDDVLRGPALAAHPEFIEPLLWGGKVCGLQIALAAAEPGVVQNLVRAAWEAKTEKTKKRSLAKSAKSAKSAKKRSKRPRP